MNTNIIDVNDDSNLSYLLGFLLGFFLNILGLYIASLNNEKVRNGSLIGFIIFCIAFIILWIIKV